MMRRLILPALLLLTACGTPQEQCITRNTRDLRVMEQLVQDTQANLARGYALEEYTVYVPVWQLCRPPAPAPGQPAPAPNYCFEREPQTKTRLKAIDLTAESAKLQSLLERRDQLAKAAEPVIAQCRAQYPE